MSKVTDEIQAYWKTKYRDHKALFLDWERRLRDSGLEDAERRSEHTGEVSHLMNGMSGAQINHRRKPGAAEFYRCCRKHTWSINPGPRRDVWSLYSEGHTQKSIYERMKPAYGMTQKAVKEIIQEERARMKANWTKELNEAFSEDVPHVLWSEDE